MNTEFRQIDSLLHLNEHLENKELNGNSYKVLLLDFDQTLVTATRYFGSESWYYFMQNQIDKDKKFAINTHYRWSVKVRKKNPYISCEPSGEITDLINKFRLSGWKVLILTARKTDMLNVTLQHIKDAGLPFNDADILFIKPFPGTKAERFKEWFESQNDAKSITNLTILFADDALKHCNDMLTLSKTIDNSIKVKIDCFHYSKAIPNANITPRQLDVLAVQLGAFINKSLLPLDDDISNDDVQKAKKILNMDDITAEILFNKMAEIVEKNPKYYFQKI